MTPNEEWGLVGKVAIVTGGGAAGEGIGNGRAAAILLARAGAHVLVVDRDLTLAERTVAMIAAEDGSAVAASYDVTSSGFHCMPNHSTFSGGNQYSRHHARFVTLPRTGPDAKRGFAGRQGIPLEYVKRPMHQRDGGFDNRLASTYGDFPHLTKAASI